MTTAESEVGLKGLSLLLLLFYQVLLSPHHSHLTGHHLLLYISPPTPKEPPPSPKWRSFRTRVAAQIGSQVARSEDELPLDPDFATALLTWQSQCRKTAGDWVFPSPITDRCFHARPILQDNLRPAGRLSGSRTWCGTLFATLIAHGWTHRSAAGRAAELMRHAHVDTTMEHGNALMESRRDANSKVVRMALRPVLVQKHDEEQAKEAVREQEEDTRRAARGSCSAAAGEVEEKQCSPCRPTSNPRAAPGEKPKSLPDLPILER